MAHLKHQSKERLKTHISDTMPVEYQKGIAAIDRVLRICWGIVDRTDDERVRLQALALIDQCNIHKMDMVTNGSIIKDALTYVNNKAEKLISESLSKAETYDEEEEEKALK
jgi:hypothetical protein